MSKQCAKCQAPLPSPLDEFGPADAPVCRVCFLSQPNPVLDELAKAEALLANVRSDLTDCLKEIEAWDRVRKDSGDTDQDSYSKELINEMHRLQNRVFEIENKVFEARRRHTVHTEQDRRRLAAWTGATS